MGKTADRPIRMPLTRMLMFWRERYLSGAVWVAVVAALVFMAREHTAQVRVVGVVEPVQATVAPLTDGRIHGLSVDLFDHVEAGNTVGLMDDTLVRAELVTAEAELGRLRAEVEAERARLALDTRDWDVDTSTDGRRFMIDAEQARLDYLDRVVEHEFNKADLERLRVLTEHQRAALEEDVLDLVTFDNTRLQYEALKRQVDEDQAALAGARQNLDAASERLASWTEDALDLDEQALLAPWKEQICVQETMIQGIKERRALLVLTAPVTGKVSGVLHRTGETILTGVPILTISAEETGRVVAYVDKESLGRVSVGAHATVSSRRKPRFTAEGTVVKMGSQLEQFPLQLQASNTLSQWGLPVLIGGLPGGVLYSGEVVDVALGVSPQALPAHD